ncbi:MAG: ABC transporter permease subunit [Actinobacteria bacterium]|nr:MAG: ABC transporter permease subunit [Actinomycetota bacterium]
MRRLESGWRPALVLAILLGAWELYADVGTSGRRLIFPAPHQVASALYSDRGLLWSNFLVTFREIVLGILLAAVAAFALAVAIHFSRTLRGALYPLIVASQTIPIPMIASLLVLWLGFGILPKLVVIGLVSFFPIVVTTLAGFASVDSEASAGLGYLYEQSINQLLTPRAYAAVAILSAFAIVLFVLLTAAERLAVPWAYHRQGEP